MGPELLSIRELHAQYHGIKALRGIDMSVEEGAITAVIGPNGAGKSTLLNLISGFVRPSEGAIRFRGESISGRKPDAIARIGVLQVPEGRRILGPLTVEENLLLGQLALGGRAGKHVYSLERVYALFPVLKVKRAQTGGSLSGGQQQMLAISRALMGGPELLMLDEPSLGLAPLIVSEVFEALQMLQRSGLTILLIEQNARRALETSSYAYVLDRGEIVQHGASTTLREDPRIVKHYLGTNIEIAKP